MFFFFKQKTAYEMRISDWSSDVCSSDLRVGGVELVVDIRSIAGSRTNPQYNLNPLPLALVDCQIGHAHIPELGGLRRTSRTVQPEVTASGSIGASIIMPTMP